MKLLRIGHKKNGEKGQSLVEFVLIVPIFLLLVFTIVDFGMGFHAWLTVTNSAREGARAGSVRADALTIEDRVRDTSSTLDQDNLTVTVTNAQGTTGDSVVVEAEYDYDLITPLGSLIDMVGGSSSLGSTLTFTSSADMRLE